MSEPIRVLFQTTIPSIDDDWNIECFSLLREHLISPTDEKGDRLLEVVSRNRDENEDGDDQVLS